MRPPHGVVAVVDGAGRHVVGKRDGRVEACAPHDVVGGIDHAVSVVVAWQRRCGRSAFEPTNIGREAVERQSNIYAGIDQMAAGGKPQEIDQRQAAVGLSRTDGGSCRIDRCCRAAAVAAGAGRMKTVPRCHGHGC